MTWLTGEPTLDDVLSDPVVHAMMARDHVDAEELRGFLYDMRRVCAAARAIPFPLSCKRERGKDGVSRPPPL